jgi:S-adenosylmethionine-dependent methyltransferase
LLKRGCHVVGVDPSTALTKLFRDEASTNGLEPEILHGDIGDLDRLLGDEVFDVVCAHGLLMYLDELAESIEAVCRRVCADGLLSLSFKNGHGLAMRPGLRGEWSRAVASFNRSAYRNELGVTATAHRLDEVESWVGAAGLGLVDWYGVRVFNDGISGDEMAPADGSLAELLTAEEMAAQTDPYRWLGSRIHFVAERSARD